MRHFELLLFLLLCSPCLFSVSDGRTVRPAKRGAPSPPIRAVNLGGWLVTEGWILPSLFDDIPNKDLLVSTFG